MTDPALRLTVLGEISRIRFELAVLQAAGLSFPPIRRYVTKLQQHLAQLEHDLREYETALAVRVVVCRSRSRCSSG
jgi:hypothetical protein